MALLQVLLPATLAHGIGDRVRQQARAIRDAAIAERARRVAETAATETSTSAAAEMPGEATVADKVVPEEAGPETATAEPANDDHRPLTQNAAHLVTNGRGAVREKGVQ